MDQLKLFPEDRKYKLVFAASYWHWGLIAAILTACGRPRTAAQIRAALRTAKGISESAASLDEHLAALVKAGSLRLDAGRYVRVEV